MSNPSLFLSGIESGILILGSGPRFVRNAMRKIAVLGSVVWVLLLAALCGRARAADKPPRWIEPPKPNEKLQLIQFLRTGGYTKCPPGAEAPPGSVRLWRRGRTLAHSSVVVPGNQQVEMGHKPGASKFESELLLPGKDPKPNRGSYTLAETWRPPAGCEVDLALLSEMVGLDREYDSPKNRWNCHGFAANVVDRCVRKVSPETEDKWVVWYAEKIGWQPIFVTTYAKYRKEERSSGYPGGGIDPKVILVKTFVAGPYDTSEAATKAVCDRMSNYRRLRGIYAGLPVADLMGRPHNIQFIRVDPKHWK
jgi:hypothetical protein